MIVSGSGFRKKILHPGKQEPSFGNGTKVTFHFKCMVLSENGEEEKILDDSKKSGCPMELIIGKQFRMPVWEECLKSMKIGEVCQLEVDKKNSISYPVVSKSYRQFAGISKKESKPACCCMTAFKDGIGESDLNVLIQKPRDLRFIIELLKAEQPGEYEKESWSMTPEEKLTSVPVLKEEGNDLYKNKNYKEASAKYAEALNRLEQLMLREKPEDDEWNELWELKLPLLLNYAQCKLMEKEYYPVIEFTTEVLERDPKNVKALYKRAKAYCGVWDLQASRDDYLKVLELDSSLKKAVQKELNELNVMQKEKDSEDSTKFRGKLF